MNQVGFKEFTLQDSEELKTERIWRNVPNRKWYAQKNGATGSSKEVVLFHKLCQFFNQLFFKIHLMEFLNYWYYKWTHCP